MPHTTGACHFAKIQLKIGNSYVTLTFTKNQQLYNTMKQNCSLRFCTGTFRTSPSPSLCVLANEPPLYVGKESR